jgi:hypothetical protein
MFKIFRKVRFYLIEQSKTKQYLLYALGEIILVVFGILLALQINEWNQDRKDKLEEAVILRNLHSEYVQNKTSLEEQKGILLQSQNSSEILMSLMGKKESEIKQYNLDSLIFWTIEYYPFNPSDNEVS